MFQIRIAGSTEIGAVRKENQDALVAGGIIAYNSGNVLSFNKALTEDQHFIVSVVDGMGGYEGGNEAAGLAALDIANITAIPTERNLRSLCARMGTRMASAGTAWGMPSMGAVFAALCFVHDGFISFNIGDCKSFRIFNDYLIQVSVDDKSLMTGALTQALSSRFQVYEPHYNYFPYNGEKERFLICSDGLLEALDIKETKYQMNRKSDPETIRKELIDIVYGKSPQDNFTFAIIDIDTTGK